MSSPDDPRYQVVDFNLVSTDPLKFTDLKRVQRPAQADAGGNRLKDAVVNAEGKINGRDVIISAMEYASSAAMGSVVGETITRAIERAIEKTQAADHGLGFRRRAHEGRHASPDADGEDLRRAGAAGRSRRSLHLAC